MRAQMKWIVEIVAITLLFCTTNVKGQTAAGMRTWTGGQQYLTCGEHILEVATSCAKSRDGDSYCFHQNLTFGKPDGSGLARTSIEHQKNSGNEDFVTGATCVSKNKKNYFILSGTNFGNCKEGCEWMDVFKESGNYVGSTGGRYGDISFKRKSLTKTGPVIFSEIDGLLRRAGTDASIEITR